MSAPSLPRSVRVGSVGWPSRLPWPVGGPAAHVEPARSAVPGSWPHTGPVLIRADARRAVEADGGGGRSGATQATWAVVVGG